jgi:hypothetical protein
MEDDMSLASFLWGFTQESLSLKPFLGWTKTDRQISRERRHLARLDPNMLRDIGLTDYQAIEESRRPFWDHPA